MQEVRHFDRVNILLFHSVAQLAWCGGSYHKHCSEREKMGSERYKNKVHYLARHQDSAEHTYVYSTKTS